MDQQWSENLEHTPISHGAQVTSRLRSIQDNSCCSQMTDAIGDLQKRCPCFRQGEADMYQSSHNLEITKQVFKQTQKEKNRKRVGNKVF